METEEIKPHVKAVAETYGVHPMLAQEFAHSIPDTQQEVAPQPEKEASLDVKMETVAQEQQSVETKAETAQALRQDSVQAKNFKQLRDKAERAERERDELARLLKEVQQKQQPDEDYSIAPDTILEGKHLSKYDKKLARMQQENEQIKRDIYQANIRLKLNAQYPDYHKVVTPDNISKLEDQYPELASTLNSSQDLYSTGVSTYTLLKKLGISVEDTYESDRYKVQQNLSKPKPVTAVSPQQGSSALAQANAFANGLTEDLRKQLIKEMAEARKGL